MIDRTHKIAFEVGPDKVTESIFDIERSIRNDLFRDEPFKSDLSKISLDTLWLLTFDIAGGTGVKSIAALGLFDGLC